MKTNTDKNFSVSIKAKIIGTGTYGQLENQSISSEAEKKIIVGSKLQAAGKTFYYSGPFKNSGLVPPKVGKDTTYTLVWSLAGNSNDLSGVGVSAFLPPYVKFLNTISPAGEDIKFDDKNSSIVWNVGNLPAGTGIITPAREAAIKVSFSPNVTQVKTSPLLASPAVVTAKDEFSNSDLNLEIPALTSALDGDPQFKGIDDGVQE